MRHVSISGADSDFHPIPDLGSRNQQLQEKRRGKLGCLIFFVATNFTKLEFFFEQVQIKLNKLTKNRSIFAQEILTRLSKIWVWDSRSGIQEKNLSWIPVPGVKKAPDPGSATKFILALNIFFSMLKFFPPDKAEFL